MPDEIDMALNPHRAEEQARAREHNRDILAQRGVRLFGNEPDNPDFVLPERELRESVGAYVQRIRAAAAQLRDGSGDAGGRPS